VTIFFLVLAACTPETAPDEAAAGCTDCALTAEQQYAYEPALTSPSMEVAAGADVEFNWVGLTTDVYGRPLPANTDRHEAWFFSTRDGEAGDLIAEMAHESLDQSTLSLFTTCVASEPSCRMTDFRLLDGANDVVERFAASDESWGLVLVNPADGGLAAVLQVEAAAAEGSERVDISSVPELGLRVELSVAPSLAVRAGEPALQIDWSAVAENGLGRPLANDNVDSLFVVRSSLPASELAGHMYDLAAVADATWTMPLGAGTTANLSGLTGSEPFTGVDADATWLLGLSCSSCSTPAPRLLTVLEAAE